MASSSSSSQPEGSLPVVLGRTNPPVPTISTKSILTKTSEKSVEAQPTEPENGEAIHGQVFVAVNITRGMPWFRKDAEPGWFVVGGRRAAERLNADWLDKKDLGQLCEDITRLGNHLHLFEDEPYVLCKSEKYCSFCLFLMTAVFVFITVAISVLNQEHSAALMITSGVLLGVTTMCCFCMNFRRRRMMDWEVPHGSIKRFAARWSRKYGLNLAFEFHQDGPSYFILKPKAEVSGTEQTGQGVDQV